MTEVILHNLRDAVYSFYNTQDIIMGSSILEVVPVVIPLINDAPANSGSSTVVAHPSTEDIVSEDVSTADVSSRSFLVPSGPVFTGLDELVSTTPGLNSTAPTMPSGSASHASPDTALTTPGGFPMSAHTVLEGDPVEELTTPTALNGSSDHTSPSPHIIPKGDSPAEELGTPTVPSGFHVRHFL